MGLFSMFLFQLAAAPNFGCVALRAAHQFAGAGAGSLAAALRHHAGDDGGVIAVDLLHQAAAADRKVVMHLRRMQMQFVVVDDVDVGLEAGAITPRS
jgi:hypothetical protein